MKVSSRLRVTRGRVSPELRRDSAASWFVESSLFKEWDNGPVARPGNWWEASCVEVEEWKAESRQVVVPYLSSSTNSKT